MARSEVTAERQQREQVPKWCPRPSSPATGKYPFPFLLHQKCFKTQGGCPEEVQCSRALLKPMESFPFTAATGLVPNFFLQNVQSRFQIFITKWWTGCRLDVLPRDGPRVQKNDQERRGHLVGGNSFAFSPSKLNFALFFFSECTYLIGTIVLFLKWVANT